MMQKNNKEIGIILVLLEHFEKKNLPQMDDVREKLENGCRIDEVAIRSITEALDHISKLQPYVERYPEYKVVVAKVMAYYGLVVSEVIANEKLLTASKI